MKKLIFLLPLLLSCGGKVDITKPIEKYKGIVVIEEPEIISLTSDMRIRCKTKDSIFYIRVSKFDAENLKPGDTIK